MNINGKIVETLREEGIDISQSLLYLLAINFGLDHTMISPEVCERVHRLGLVSRDYKNGGKPILTRPLFEIPANDELEIKDIVSSKIEEWAALWPKPLETGLTYTVSGNLPQATARMRTFISVQWEKHGLEKKNMAEKWEIIMTATIAYLAYQKAKQWAYTKKSVKFIGDLEGSVLAEWCQKVMDKKIPQQNTVIDRLL